MNESDNKNSTVHLYLLLLIGLLGYLPAMHGQIEVWVLDSNSAPLSYVDVYTTDYSYSAVTNNEGFVRLPARLSDSESIVFSLIGYRSAQVAISDLRLDNKIILQMGVVLEEVTMVGRTDNRSRDLAGQVESINSKIFALTNPQTPADALGQHADVYIQKSQMGGGSPVVRGFEANKVLLVLDGVRMNNAIFRSGHLQSAITVDNAMLERLEVLYGPGSLIYGSDAIGGVVHFRSKNPKLNLDEDQQINLSGNAYVRSSSANKEKSGHIDINIGTSTFGSLSSVSYSDYGDLRTGARRGDDYPDFGKRLIYADRIDGQDVIIDNPNPNVQVGTGYSQVDLMQKFLYRPSERLRLIANLQYSTSSNVPRYDALSERDDNRLTFAEWYYGPQNRFLSSIRMDLTEDLSFADKVIVIGAYQNIDEDRIDRRFGSTNLDQQRENVDVWSLTVDLHKYLTADETFEINYGLDFTKNVLSSTAFREDIQTNEIAYDIPTRYPSGGGETDNIAAYALMKKSFSGLDLFAGARYSRYGIGVSYLRSDSLPWPEEYYDGVMSSNDAVSWSIGTSTKPVYGWKVKAQISSAFRAPNIDDLAKIRVNSSEISVPNLALRPERSLNGELTISKRVGQHVHLSATGFCTNLQDAIVRDDFTFLDGQNFLVDEGDTLATVANINAERAIVTGLSLNAKASINKNWSVEGSWNYVKGRSINQQELVSPLAHIPPIYGRANIAYANGNRQIRLTSQYNGNKPVSLYGGSEDNLENATPDGTPAWVVFNLYYQQKLTDQLSMSVGLENIFDVHYRPFASGVSAPGRNVIASLQCSF